MTEYNKHSTDPIMHEPNKIGATPPLDNLISEYSFIKEGIELAKKRIEGQLKLPDYMFKTLSVLTRAYILTACTYYPSDLKHQKKVLEKGLNDLKTMFKNQQNLEHQLRLTTIKPN